MCRILKTLFLFTWFVAFALLASPSVLGQTADDIQWQRLETKYTIIRYQSWEDLKTFCDRINYAPSKWAFNSIFSASNKDSLEGKLIKKVDAVFTKVQNILEMHKQISKVTIDIYSNKIQLNTAYNKINQSAFSAFRTTARLRAWYIYENNTIYMNVKDLHERMLAHEMAHAIVDQYLSVRPPRATAEILARYVDRHLNR